MNEKTASQLTDEILSKMKQAQKFRIIRQVPDDFEFRGSSPFDISINSKGVMTFQIYATSLEEAQKKVDDYLDPFSD
ncbi:MAG: hypothetical protein EBU90_14000 [Proteobacteria bacterium]|nr:hypothetical protein [Pseudomonadota bacterium]